MAVSTKEKPDLQKKVHEVPHKPGVYLMRDRFNRVIYVGKARDLRKRVGSYFLPSKLAQADLKTRAMLDATWDFETHTVRSEAESVLLEGKLIKEYRPRYNISFRDDKRFLLVRVDLSEEWPRFRLARFKKDDGSRYFGPYAHAGALRQTLNFMRKKFGVLTFGRGSPSERELKSSTYQVPVRLSEINAEQYRERVLQAGEFLEGKSREMIATLEEEMRKAAKKMDFEKAAELRNMIDDLRSTTKPMRRFTRGSLPSTIDPMADVRALADALQLSRVPRSDGMFRYLKYFHDARCCFDGLFPGWRSGQGQLPPLSGADSRRPGRFRQHGRGRPAQVFACSAGGTPCKLRCGGVFAGECGGCDGANFPAFRPNACPRR